MRRLVLVWALIVSSGRLVAAPASEVPDRRWREGPVRYLLTEEEFERYGKLETQEARAAFVERFWQRRDPDPATPRNEARERFEELCQKANQRFFESSRAGWQTDRGRVLILLGEPDSVRRDAGEARGRDREIWTYVHPPGGGASLEIPFYRNHGGRFVLLVEHDDELPSHESSVDRERARQRIREQIRSEYKVSGIALEQLTALLLGQEENPFLSPARPGEPEVQRGRPKTGAATARSASDLGFAMSDAAYYFRSADGSVLVLIALEFRPSATDPAQGHTPIAAYVARAFLRSEAGDAGTLDPKEPADEIVLEPHDGADDGSVLFVGQAHLDPGLYALRCAVFDPVHRSLAVRSVDLEVPELEPGRFRASSLVPADRFGTASKADQAVFAVGSEEVVPRPSGRFRRGEPVRLYLQVYDAARDPISKRPRVDVQFRFERSVPGGHKLHGRPLVVTGAEGASMGLALPVGDWPSGEYRVVVALHDRVSGARTETEGSFLLDD